MTDISKIKERMDVISDRKMVGKVDHLAGIDKIELTKQSSPDIALCIRFMSACRMSAASPLTWTPTGARNLSSWCFSLASTRS
jgi:hypothetical protein